VTPMTALFLAALDDAGAVARMEDDGAITATGLTAAQIGDLATDRCLTVHELTPLRGSLEDAFMELTHSAVEFEAHSRSHSHSHSAS
jgi:ABC-2 type transport system ATP-binding protein